MPKPKKRLAYVSPPPAYLTLQRQLCKAPEEPSAVSPGDMPSTARWRILLDKTGITLQMVADEMQTYSDARLPAWYDTPGAALYLECLDDLFHLHGLLDDLRSNF